MRKKLILFIETNSDELLEQVTTLIEEHYGYEVVIGFEEDVED